jgi:alpha-beta hydrolase superfamily lysophospholipase
LNTDNIVVICNGLEISGVVHLPGRLPAPCVICSHGLFSAKASPKFMAVAEHLAQEGFVAIRYDHRGCGESGGRIEDTTVSGRLQDLEAVYGFARRDARVGKAVGLMGSSMGGYVSLFAAARHPEIQAVVVWATPYKLRGKKRDFDDAGYPFLQEVFYEDLKKYRLDEMLPTVHHCLVLHGESDELVPAWHAKSNHGAMTTPKELKIFPGGDHRFTDEAQRRAAIETTATWFKTHLKN